MNLKELKFRAWHIMEKKLCEVATLTDEGAFLIGVLKGKDQIQDRMIVVAPERGRFCPTKDILVTQYTGLVDKNGKKIFEGDVVSYGNNIASIVPMKYGWGVNSGTTIIHLQNLQDGIPDTFEIVGNVFERDLINMPL